MKKELKRIGQYATVLLLSSVMVVSCGESTEETNGESTKEAAKDNEDATPETPEEVEIVEYDMNEQGIPVVITGPAGAEITSMMSKELQESIGAIEYSIDKGDFSIDLYMRLGDLDGADVAYFVALSKSDESDKIVEEFDSGYITIDKYGGHDFVHIIEKEGKIIECSVGQSLEDLSLEKVHELIGSIK